MNLRCIAYRSIHHHEVCLVETYHLITKHSPLAAQRFHSLKLNMCRLELYTMNINKCEYLHVVSFFSFSYSGVFTTKKHIDCNWH